MEVLLAFLALGVATLLITQGVVVLLRRRKSRLPAAGAVPASVPGAPPAPPSTRDMTCCSKPAWVPEHDVGSARGFDFMLGKCGACGTPWIRAFCVASSIGGFEPVTPEDAAAMRVIGDPGELKEFMRRWAAYLG